MLTEGNVIQAAIDSANGGKATTRTNPVSEVIGSDLRFHLARISPFYSTKVLTIDSLSCNTLPCASLTHQTCFQTPICPVKSLCCRSHSLIVYCTETHNKIHTGRVYAFPLCKYNRDPRWYGRWEKCHWFPLTLFKIRVWARTPHTHTRRAPTPHP